MRVQSREVGEILWEPWEFVLYKFYVYRNVDRGSERGGIVFKQVKGKRGKEWVKEGRGYHSAPFYNKTRKERKGTETSDHLGKV
jgi:hypothetical protein